MALLASSAQAATVGLGTAANFAVLAGSTVTNTGPSVISGDLGLSPGTAVTGFPPGTVKAGTIHAADSVALQAQRDLTTAYNDAAGRSSTATISADLAGRTLTPGVYTSASSLGLSGALTLNAEGNANAVFVFQAGSKLTAGSGSRVRLTGGAQACHVFWQVGSSATIGTSSTFVGNILALTSISMKTGATLDGRALARNGAVTLDTNTITKAVCAAATKPKPKPKHKTTPTPTPKPTTKPKLTNTPLTPGCKSAGPAYKLPTFTFVSNAGLRKIKVVFRAKTLKVLTFKGKGPKQFKLNGVRVPTKGLAAGAHSVTVTGTDVKGKSVSRTVRFTICQAKPVFTG